jgi:hypothetical protein
MREESTLERIETVVVTDGVVDEQEAAKRLVTERKRRESLESSGGTYQPGGPHDLRMLARISGAIAHRHGNVQHTHPEQSHHVFAHVHGDEGQKDEAVSMAVFEAGMRRRAHLHLEHV